MRRAAREGDGSIPAYLPVDVLKTSIERIRDLRQEYGRDKLPSDVSGGAGGTPTVDEVRRYEEVGVTHVTVGPYGFPTAETTADDIGRGLETFANDVIVKL